MKRTILLTASLLCATLPAYSQMNYQGRLTGAQGGALIDGQYTLEFSLWDAPTGGNRVWGPYVADGGSGVGRGPMADLVNSSFNLIIGNADTQNRSLADGVASAANRYLEIKVGSNPAITPRQLILASPRALSADSMPNVKPSGANVGVGTTSASARLHVVAGGSTSPHQNGLLVKNPTPGNEQHAIIAAQVANSASGNPFFSLDVEGEAGWAIGMDNQDGNKLKFGSDWNSFTNPRMTITPDGKVGIGTTAPNCTLFVRNNSTDGTACFDPGGGGLVSLVHFGVNQDWFIRSGKPSGTVLVQPDHGNIQLGNMTVSPRNHFGSARADAITLDIPGTTGSIDIWDNLEVNANCYVHQGFYRNIGGNWASLEDNGGSNRWAYWSDARLKKDIVPLTGALDTIARLRGVSYQWTDDGLAYLTRNIEKSWRSKSGTEADNKKLWAEKRAEAEKPLRMRQTGFIAQELEKVFPEWVTTDEKGFKQIDTHNMAAVLVQGINELTAQNKDQAATLAALEKENAPLKAQLTAQAAKDKAQDEKLAALAALLEKRSSATAGVTAKAAGR